ncbi:MAG TPA: hypothetical protein VGB79_01685 [Allosphingosinicella sp.]|jgi:predicted DNA-binding transcriptional regulator AlpA
MKLDAVLAHVGKSRPTVFRWIKTRGFPRPLNGEWNDAEVERWWAENSNKVGRWPVDERRAT